MVLDLGDGGERDFDYLSVSTQHFYARRRERLSVLHTAHRAADALSVGSNDFNIVFTVQRLQSRQRLRYFHLESTSMRFKEPGAPNLR